MSASTVGALNLCMCCSISQIIYITIEGVYTKKRFFHRQGMVLTNYEIILEEVSYFYTCRLIIQYNNLR